MIKTLFVLNGGEADWSFDVGQTYLGHKVIKIEHHATLINHYVIRTDKGDIHVNSNNSIAFIEQK